MTFDVLAAAAMADELRNTLLHGRVQEVLLPEPMGIGLEIYAGGRRHYLYATANAQEARVQLAGDRLRRGPDRPSPLLLLLRKHVLGGRLVEVEQPGRERVLRLAIQAAELVYLYIEAMGRHSNIILVDFQGQVLGAVKRVGAQLSRRVILPGQPYTPPPPQGKTSYASLSPGRLAELMAEQGDGPAWKALVAHILGVSPLLAREVIYRVSGDPNAADAAPGAVLAELDKLLGLVEAGGWQSGVAVEGGRAVAYSPYPLTHYPYWEMTETLSEAMTLYYSQRREIEGYAEARAAVQELVDAGRARLRRQREALEQELGAAADRESLVQRGQLILAYSAQIAPGQRELAVDLGEAELLRIPLDAQLTPAENAQALFREYDKAKAAAARVPPLLEDLAAKEATLDQLEADLLLAENRAEIDQARAELVEAGYGRAEGRGGRSGHAQARRPSPKGRPAVGRPRRYRTRDGFRVWVGRNSRQNEALTFDQAKPDDLWLHARGVPGSHVLLVSEGRQVPPRAILEAAELAAHFSRARQDAQVDVSYAAQRFVHRLPGGGPGMVTLRRESVVRVAPRDWGEEEEVHHRDTEDTEAKPG